MKKSILALFGILFFVACSRSPGPGDTFLEMQKKICEKQSLKPLLDYSAPESLALIGFIAELAEDEKKGPKIKENIAENCKTETKIIEEKIDGESATLIVSSDKKPQTMRKVDGKWKLVIKKDEKNSKPDEQTKDNATNTEKKSDADVCIDKKLTEVRKEIGEEAQIPNSVLTEIEESCGGKM